MAKKSAAGEKPKTNNANAYIAGAGTVVDSLVTDTLKSNFMPYAMSVIVSRAIPEIDGFKPSHRKLLYTMYNMGLLNGGTIKSANIVGRTMQLNPHGDAAIYETMVRLSEGNEALLHPFVPSKGSFGKAYSRDMQYAAARYTEAKLAPVSAELFKDIDKETVDFVDNYDSTMKEPVLFPVTFPTVLVNANMGIAAGMASSICPFNLEEVCRTAIALIRDKDADIFETLLAPDFPIGGELIYDKAAMEQIYTTGHGGFKVRGVYTYDKSANCIDITEIPPTTTIEAIIEKVIELVKQKKITEINDIRDETDLSGLKITVDLKRGTDPDKLMKRLFKLTPLQDTFSCNFNILISSIPKVMGVKEILTEWTAFRHECIRRRVFFSLEKAKKKMHLLKGLEKILLDIDKAVKIVRETEEEKEVVPNLMIGFGIDREQAENVAEIKLRHLNREYILNRTKEIEELLESIKDMEDILASRRRIYTIIIKELEEVIKKYGQPRKTKIIYDLQADEPEEEQPVDDSPIHIFFTKEGYFKKFTPLQLRMSGEQKLKEGDEITDSLDTTNDAHLLFFTDKQQVYKTRAFELPDSKAAALGEYIPSRLAMEQDEQAVSMAVTKDYKGFLLFVFDNGRIAKVALQGYDTKQNRKKLINAYSDKFKLFKIIQMEEEGEIKLQSSNGRILLVSTAELQTKTTKNNSGVSVMTQKKGHCIVDACVYVKDSLPREHRYRVKSLPAAGSFLGQDEAKQISLI
ncbi:MAG: topoisomerase IV [Oscillospiraceae bacterium]|nr:topoisomerase IV [Candidatus Equicaccousia limihippi]